MYQYKELKRLLKSHKEQLQTLEENCRKIDGTKGFVCRSSSLNIRKDIPVFFLCYKDGHLLGYLNLFLPGNKEAELNVLVHPAFRQQGIFTILLSKADAVLSKINIRRRLFVSESQVSVSSAVMKAMRGKLINSEYQMIYHPFSANHINPSTEFGCLLPAETNDLTVLAQMEALFFCTDYENAKHLVHQSLHTPNITVYKYVYQGIPIGTASLCIENYSCSIFGLGILPPYRGKGFGRHLLISLITQTPADKKLYLQVSGENAVALQLYLNSGFQVTLQQDFWLLPGKNKDRR